MIEEDVFVMVKEYCEWSGLVRLEPDNYRHLPKISLKKVWLALGFLQVDRDLVSLLRDHWFGWFNSLLSGSKPFVQ